MLFLPSRGSAFVRCPSRITTSVGRSGPLLRKTLEPRRLAGLNRRARRVEHHPNQRVVTHKTDGVEEALLAELRDRAGVGGVADTAVLQQLRAEVIQRFLI